MEYIQAIIEFIWNVVTIPLNVFGFNISIFNVLIFSFLLGSFYKLIFGGKNGGSGND